MIQDLGQSFEHNRTSCDNIYNGDKNEQTKLQHDRDTLSDGRDINRLSLSNFSPIHRAKNPPKSAGQLLRQSSRRNHGQLHQSRMRTIRPFYLCS